MPTVAEQLRQAREAQNLTVYQVAETTKIKTDHVRALEAGNFETFSATVYIRGFVRVYAALLKLDVPAILSALDAELAQTEKFREPPSLMGESRSWLDFCMLQLSKMNWRLAVGAVVLVVVVVLAAWGFYAWQSHPSPDPLSNLGPGLYQAPASGADQTLPLPTNSAPSGKR